MYRIVDLYVISLEWLLKPQLLSHFTIFMSDNIDMILYVNKNVSSAIVSASNLVPSQFLKKKKIN